MTNEDAIKFANRLKNNYTIDFNDMADFCNMAIKALEQQPCDDCVSLGVYKQVIWERDIAIEQLKELGYGFGEKIRTSEDCMSREQALLALTGTNLGEKSADELIALFDKRMRALPPVTPTFPKGTTNGDVIKAMFTDLDVEIEGNHVTCWIDEHRWLSFDYIWWNAPYKTNKRN